MMSLLAVGTLFRPAVALAGVFCLYGIEQWGASNSFFFSANHRLTNIITGLVVLEGLAVKLFRGQLHLKEYPRAGWLFLALYAVAGLSVFWSIYPEATIERMASMWPYVVLSGLLAPLLISGPSDLRAAFLATLALGSLTVALLLFDAQWNVYQRIVVEGISRATDAGQTNPLAIAQMAGYVVIIAVLMNFRGVARFWQLARWGIVALALALIFKAGSRGQLFGAVIAVLAFLPISRRIRNIQGFIATSVGVVLVAGLAHWAYGHFALERRWDLEVMTTAVQGGRIGPAMQLLGAWLESNPLHWLVGLGSSASFDPQIIGFYPHMVPLEILGEEGLLGFGIFLAFLAVTINSFRRMRPVLGEDPELRGLLAVLAALFAYEFILMCKQGCLMGDASVFCFAIMLGRLELSLRRHAAETLPLEYYDPEGNGYPEYPVYADRCYFPGSTG